MHAGKSKCEWPKAREGSKTGQDMKCCRQTQCYASKSDRQWIGSEGSSVMHCGLNDIVSLFESIVGLRTVLEFVDQKCSTNHTGARQHLGADFRLQNDYLRPGAPFVMRIAVFCPAGAALPNQCCLATFTCQTTSPTVSMHAHLESGSVSCYTAKEGCRAKQSLAEGQVQPYIATHNSSPHAIASSSCHHGLD